MLQCSGESTGEGGGGEGEATPGGAATAATE